MIKQKDSEMDRQTYIMKVRPSQGSCGTGENGIYFRGIGEHRPHFEGNRGSKTVLGTGNIRKQIFEFLGQWNNFISRKYGNKYPPPPPPPSGRSSKVVYIMTKITHPLEIKAL